MNFVYDPQKEKGLFYWLKKNIPQIGNEAFERVEKKLRGKPIDPKEHRVKEIVEAAAKRWDEIKEQYLKEMAKFFEVENLEDPEVTFYLTRGPAWPFDWEEGWSTTTLFGSTPQRMKTVMHELFHYFFWKLSWPEKLKERGWSEKETKDFREALTVFLNDRKRFPTRVEDKGHLEQKKLRDFLWKDKDKIRTITQAASAIESH